jgi:hypothetical protein
MARQAATYRSQRVLLAGDAAHVHSPVGGQGLNTGVQDAVNLGWKLAQVVNGISPDALLDTYHAERHPVAARVLRNTLAFTALDRGDERTEALREFLAPTLRMDGPRRHYGGMLSGLDIHYDLDATKTDVGGDVGNDVPSRGTASSAHPLLGRRCPDLELTTAAGLRRVFTFLHEAKAVLLDLGTSLALDVTPWQRRVQRVDATYSGAWELPVLGEVTTPGAVLVRPDGYVAWVGVGTDAGLREALTKWFGDGD